MSYKISSLSRDLWEGIKTTKDFQKVIWEPATVEVSMYVYIETYTYKQTYM